MGIRTRKILKPEDVSNSSAVYWGHGDNVLTSDMVRTPYTHDDIQLLLNRYSLFAERVCILDICLLNNLALRKLLQSSKYDILLSEGILVPTLRSSVDSISELEFMNRRDDTAYVKLDREMGEQYSQFLDAKAKKILITDQAYYEQYLTKNLDEAFYDPELLRQFGLQSVIEEWHRFAGEYKARWNTENLRRSALFFFADELARKGHPQYAARVKLLSSGIYNYTFYSGLSLRPAMPTTYARDLSKRFAQNKEEDLTGSADSNFVDEEEFRIRNSDLVNLNPDEIVMLRRTKEAKSYFNSVRVASGESELSKAAKIERDALLLYLGRIQTEIGLKISGKKKIHTRKSLKLSLATYGGIGGSAALSLGTSVLSGSPALAAATSLTWGFGSFLIHRRISKEIRDEELHANEMYRALRDSIGDDRPVFGSVSGDPRRDRPRF